ncbi:MAG: hypothetical protein OWU33_11600 [Firmicutes bacterium]|nr:hypothetical protein [Bacillota bacterium]
MVRRRMGFSRVLRTVGQESGLVSGQVGLLHAERHPQPASCNVSHAA